MEGQSAHGERFLLMLLQQPAFVSQQGLVCKLLCTSKGVAAAVRQDCRGQVNVCCSERQRWTNDWCSERTTVSFWFAKYGQLAKSLEIPSICCSFFDEETVASTLHSFNLASTSGGASTPPSSRLLLQCYSGPACVRLFKELLPLSSLTSLTVHSLPLLYEPDYPRTDYETWLARGTALTDAAGDSSDSGSEGPWEEDASDSALAAVEVARARASLGRLQQLRQLQLGGNTAALLLPGVACLSNLRHLKLRWLQLEAFGALGGFKALPQQLEQLTVESEQGSFDARCHVESLSISHCTALTSVALEGVSWSSRDMWLALLPQLPAQVQQLRVRFELHQSWYQRIEAALQLGQLTGLTSLALEGVCLLGEGSSLPPGLHELRLGDAPLAVLSRLRQLQALQLTDSSATAAELAALGSSLGGQLQQVQLGYQHKLAQAADEAAAGWAALPVRGLCIDASDLGDYTFHLQVSTSKTTRLGPLAISSLGQLTRLTSLAMLGNPKLAQVERFGCPEANSEELAAALLQLTRLQQLRLGDLAFPGHGRDAARAGSTDAASLLVQAVAQLPQLVQLTLKGMALDASSSSSSGSSAGGDAGGGANDDGGGGSFGYPHDRQQQQQQQAAWMALAAATQLTCLQLLRCSMGEDAVLGLAGSLGRLGQLVVEDAGIKHPYRLGRTLEAMHEGTAVWVRNRLQLYSCGAVPHEIEAAYMCRRNGIGL